jgi:hypothetical protein
MCIALRNANPESELRLARLVEYFEPIKKELVFDLFFDLTNRAPCRIWLLHRGNIRAVVIPGGVATLVFQDWPVLVHGAEAKWLSYVASSDRVTFDGRWRRETPKTYFRPDNPQLNPLRSGADVPDDRHRAFSAWELSVPAGQDDFAVRIHMSMTNETAVKLTGKPKNERPDYFGVYGDSLLLDAVDRELSLAESLQREALRKTFSEFMSKPRIAPEIFECIESAQKSRRYIGQPLSVNTYRQPVPANLTDSTNWFILTPDSESQRDCYYDRFEVRFA